MTLPPKLRTVPSEWKSQPCRLVSHAASGLRFFVWDNLETRQVDVVIFDHFADAAWLEREAGRAGLSIKHFKERLSELAMDEAERR